MLSAGALKFQLYRGRQCAAAVRVTEESFIPVDRKFCPCNRISTLRDDHWRFIMNTGRDMTDVATKAAYFCLAAATIVFAAMLLLTGIHP
jgi:hypothetical protein